MIRFFLIVFLVFYPGFSVFAQSEAETQGVVAVESDGFLEAGDSNEVEEAPGEAVSSDEGGALTLEDGALSDIRGEGLVKPDYPRVSMLFTFWEYSALGDAIRARNLGGFSRTPTDQELQADLGRFKEEDRVKPPPEERYISLGGIVYNDEDDWTIWLNGQRVRPDALPEEIINLRVFKDYIELYWLDQWGNKIYPVRLRPHQRFNVDTRIFLPG